MNFEVAIVFSATFIAGVLTLYVINKTSKWLKLLLSFSGAYIFGLTIIHLLPETYETNTVKYIALYILGGFFLQIILEYFSQGTEHGHAHVHKGNPFPVMLFISLFIHALLEGNLLDSHNQGNHIDKWSYVFGLSVHKIPVAVVLGIILKNYFKTGTSITLIALFALATPIGTFISSQLTEDMVMIVNGIVAGSFLHISTTILFESTPDHKFDFPKFLMAIIGALASLLLL